jgi:hypothetical protein
MPITVKLPPLFSRLLPYVTLINEFEDMPPVYVPMARLVLPRLSLNIQVLFLFMFHRRFSGHECLTCQSARCDEGKTS